MFQRLFNMYLIWEKFIVRIKNIITCHQSDLYSFTLGFLNVYCFSLQKYFLYKYSIFISKIIMEQRFFDFSIFFNKYQVPTKFEKKMFYHLVHGIDIM